MLTFLSNTLFTSWCTAWPNAFFIWPRWRWNNCVCWGVKNPDNFFFSWEAVPTTPRLCSAPAEWREDFWSVQNLCGRRRRPVAPGLLWHDHRWWRMAGKRDATCWPPVYDSHLFKYNHRACGTLFIWIVCEAAVTHQTQNFSDFPQTPEWKAGILPELEELHCWIW